MLADSFRVRLLLLHLRLKALSAITWSLLHHLMSREALGCMPWWGGIGSVGLLVIACKQGTKPLRY